MPRERLSRAIAAAAKCMRILVLEENGHLVYGDLDRQRSYFVLPIPVLNLPTTQELQVLSGLGMSVASRRDQSAIAW